jgi:hypothetical protein
MAAREEAAKDEASAGAKARVMRRQWTECIMITCLCSGREGQRRE